MAGDRVLVTGGAGFIGSALADRYAPEVGQWVVFDNLLPQVHGINGRPALHPAAMLVEGDVRDRAALTRAVSECRPDVVIHLAAETGTGQSLTEPSRHTDVNATGTAVLFEALDSHLPRRLVLTSSRAVYGEGSWQASDGRVVRPGPRPASMLAHGLWDFPDLVALPSASRSSVPDPSNVYGATKLAQEHLVTSWTAARGVEPAILRLQNVYGPGQSPINPYTGITTLFVRLAHAGKSIPVFEDGHIVRDFVFIDDVVQAIASAVSAPGPVLADVGSGVPTSIAELAEAIAGILEAPAPSVTGQYRLGDVRHASCDMTDSEWVRNDGPATELGDGLRRLSNWIVGLDLEARRE